MHALSQNMICNSTASNELVAAASFCFICNLLPGGHVLHGPGRPPHQEVLQIHPDSGLAEHIDKGLQHRAAGQQRLNEKQHNVK